MRSQDLGAEGHVLEDGLGKGVGPLEDHPHPLPQAHGVHLGGIDVLPVQKDRAGDPGVGDEFIHPVEGPEKGRFAAAGRSDEGGDLPFFDFEVDLFQGLERPVKKIQAFGFHFDR